MGDHEVLKPGEALPLLLEAGGNISEMARLVEERKQRKYSRQAAHKHQDVRCAVLLHKMWGRRDGMRKNADTIQKEIWEKVQDGVIKPTAREVRAVRNPTGQRELFEERLEEMRGRLRDLEEKEKAAASEGSTVEDADRIAEELGKIRDQRKALESVIQNVQVEIGRLQTEIQDAEQNLQNGLRWAVQRVRDEYVHEALDRLKAVLDLNRTFSRVVIEALNGLGQEHGMKSVNASILGLYDTDLLPPGDEVGTVVRELERRLNADTVAAEKKARSEAYEKRFHEEKPRTPHVTGELVQL